MGRRPELTGGGLIRTMGGWVSVKALCKAKAYMKGDERILGDGDFVNEVLAHAQEDYEQRYRLASMGLTVDDVAVRQKIGHILYRSQSIYDPWRANCSAK